MPSDDASLKDRAQNAVETAVETLAEASDADTAMKAGEIEDKAIETLADELGNLVAEGLSKSPGFYARIVADEATYHTTTAIKQQIKEASERHATVEKGRQRLDEFLQERLKGVDVHRTTDAKQGAQFTWDFGNFKVETQGGKDGRGHYHWANFRNLIHETGGPNLADPENGRKDGAEWREFVSQLIDERGDVTRITGARTLAVQHLENEIKQNAGYGTSEGAIEWSNIWLVMSTVDVPDWWSVFGESLAADRDVCEAAVEQVRIHEQLIETVISDADITRSALYTELKARNHTLPGGDGASMHEYVDGARHTFWALSPSLATPRIYVPDANAKDSAAAFEPVRDSEPSPTDADDTTGGLSGVGDVQ